MNSVGIDVSKGKSTVCLKRVSEEALSSFGVNHTASELSELARLLKSLDGEIRVIRPSRKSCVKVDHQASRKQEQIKGLPEQGKVQLNRSYPPVFRDEGLYAHAA